MAENEKLDVGYRNSGRRRKWRDSIRTGKSARQVADEGIRSLFQTVKNPQKRFEVKKSQKSHTRNVGDAGLASRPFGKKKQAEMVEDIGQGIFKFATSMRIDASVDLSRSVA